MNVYLCRFSYCGSSSYSARQLIAHMKLSHSDTLLPDFTCNIDGCISIYRSIDAFRKHLSRVHSNHWKAFGLQSFDNVEYECSDNEDAFNVQDSEIDTLDMADDHCQSVSKFKGELCQNIIFSRLKTTELHMLPKSTAAAIFDNVKELMNSYQIGFQNLVSSRLTAMGIDYSSDEILSQMLKPESHFESVTTTTASDHLLKKYCSSHLKLTEPVPVFIEHLDSDGDLPKGSIQDKVLVGHYVPILTSLSNYLKHSDVWASCQRPRNDGSSPVMRDYDDGLVWQLSGLAHDHLRIHLYSDEFEVCNPIGSRKGTHKVCAFYYTVGNVNIKYRSQLKNIHLAMLLKYKNGVRKYGYKRVMEPLIRDLAILEQEGITIVVDGKNLNVKGSIVTLSGDNLSMHGIGGFNPTFSSGRICRHCMISYSGLSEVESEEKCQVRTSENHIYHVQSILKERDLKVVYGVYDECPLSCLSYFDPVQCLPPDVMHDVLEGVAIFSVDFIIKTLVRRRALNMKTVTKCMQTFAYGRADVNDRPEALSENFVKSNKSISGKAVEKWTLFRLLPLYIGHLVTEDCLEWQAYLLCRQICDVVLAPVVSKDDLSMLELLIAHHHQLLVKLGARVIPKMHYLVHYPRLMLLFGPLRPLWSMRFEANHQYFKQLARRVRNFRNITGTLSERYQRKKCCEQAGQNCLGSLVSFPEANKPLLVKSLPLPLQNVLLSKFNLAKDAQCTSVSWLQIEGLKVFKDGYLILEKPDDQMPNFLKISYILHHMGLWLVCGNLALSKCFIHHHHAYELNVTNEWLAVVPSEAMDSHPVLSSYILQNNAEVVVFRHGI
jgi:hypothetical protein